MKRWITGTCAALLCSAALGQTCDKSAQIGADHIVRIVSAPDKACAKPGNWLSVAYHRAQKAKAPSSCCPEGQSVAAAIIATAGSVTLGGESCTQAKAACAESAVVQTVASEAKTCTATSECTSDIVAVQTVAADNKTCTAGKTACTGSVAVQTVASESKTCTATGSGDPDVVVLVDGFADNKTCTATSACSSPIVEIQTIAAPVALTTTRQVATKQTETKAGGACCTDGGAGACCDEGAAASISTVALIGPVNDKCPMTGRPVAASATVEYKDATIGFCGAGCMNAFKNAAAEKQEAVYQTVLASQPTGAAQTAEFKGDPYTLDTCAVSGGKLGSMGEPIVKVVNGRQVKFCCQNCVPAYEADPAKYNEKIDAKMVKAQLPFYPEATCAIAGTDLVRDGKDVGVNLIVNNRLVRVCCNNCAAKVKADPAPVLAKLDKAVIAKQAENYPLDHCLVMEEDELAEVDPVRVVAANHLVQFCCKGCIKRFQADPAAYLAKLDKAWAAKYPDKFQTANATSTGG